MSDQKLPRLLAEGVQALVEKRVTAMVEQITAEIVADKVKELEEDLTIELQQRVYSCPGQLGETLNIMLEITTKKGGNR